MQNILVTGAGGYIGIPLCQMLAQKGFSVVALDRGFFGRDRFMQAASHPNIKLLVDDIRTVEPKQFEGMDAVIDLAGLSNDASAEIDPELTVSINHQGGVRLARAAKRAGVRRYVYSSSASVYGHGQEIALNEHAVCRPQTLYAESKLHVEDELRKLQRDRIRNKVDHPRGGSKDVADALAAVVFSLTTKAHHAPLMIMKGVSKHGDPHVDEDREIVDGNDFMIPFLTG